MEAAFLYTGQGWQYPGMLRDVPDSAEKRLRFEEAGDVLGRRITDLDAAETMDSNENVQLCIFLAETVLTAAARERCGCLVTSGHSIGSFAAAVASGAVSFADALRLVEARGRTMEALFSAGYGMLAVHGLTHSLSDAVLAEFCAENPGAEVYAAARNEELQCVYSGRRGDLADFRGFMQKRYPVRCQLLRVKVPSHCVLMRPVSELLERLTGKMAWHALRTPYLANSTGDRVWRPEPVRRDLIDGVSRTVRWYDGVSMMQELGVERFVEISLDGTLTAIGRRCAPELQWLRLDQL